MSVKTQEPRASVVRGLCLRQEGAIAAVRRGIAGGARQARKHAARSQPRWPPVAVSLQPITGRLFRQGKRSPKTLCFRLTASIRESLSQPISALNGKRCILRKLLLTTCGRSSAGRRQRAAFSRCATPQRRVVATALGTSASRPMTEVGTVACRHSSGSWKSLP